MPSKKRGRETKALLEVFATHKKQKTEDKTVNLGEEETSETEEQEAEQKTSKTDKHEADQKTKLFEAALEVATDDQIYWEYMCFIKQLPLTLPENIRKNWTRKVTKHLKIKALKRRLRRNSRLPTFNSSSLDQTPVLDAMSTMLGQGWRIIAPPTSDCIHCKRPLTKHNKATQVKFHSRGTVIATKYSLRCRMCREARKLSGKMFGPPENILYHPTRYLLLLVGHLHLFHLLFLHVHLLIHLLIPHSTSWFTCPFLLLLLHLLFPHVYPLHHFLFPPAPQYVLYHHHHSQRSLQVRQQQPRIRVVP